MLVKTILVFLLVMALVGLIGKALFPGAMRKVMPKAPVCRKCGRYVVGKTCGCDKRG